MGDSNAMATVSLCRRRTAGLHRGLKDQLFINRIVNTLASAYIEFR